MKKKEYKKKKKKNDKIKEGGREGFRREENYLLFLHAGLHDFYIHVFM